MNRTYRRHCAMILMTALVGSCSYLVAESVGKCRMEAEKFLGYTIWEELDCTADKDDDAGPLLDAVRKRKPSGDKAH